ncbi:lipid II:glycine glycyltransferase FemX [Sporosarcina sp. CAU 1771]
MVIESQAEWNEIIKSLEFSDVYYTYEYCTAFATHEKGQAKLIYYKNDCGIVVYPIIVREIDSNYKQVIYDIITPYGYGGPLHIGDVGVMRSFRDEFISYCKSETIISEVITFHPLFKNASSMIGYCTLNYRGETTAVDLTNDLEDIRSQYTSMNKRNIRKAYKKGVTCQEVIKNKENIEVFLSLYNETMNRNLASEFYFFTYEFIEKQLVNTEISNSHLLFAYHEEQVISAILLYTTEKFAHYHLGASRTESLPLRPNNLLFDYMIEFSKSKNCTLIHLGGGYEKNDNLFKYKVSFTNNNNYEYYFGTTILDSTIYKYLVQEKQNLDLQKDYFPLYRARNKDEEYVV